MSKTKVNKPDIVQSFDFYKDREYYKIVSGFIFSHNKIVRTDRLEDWNEWIILCEKLPNKIDVNGKKYKLVALNSK